MAVLEHGLQNGQRSLGPREAHGLGRRASNRREGVFGQVHGRKNRFLVAEPEESLDRSRANQRHRITCERPQQRAGVVHSQPSKTRGGNATDACILITEGMCQRRGAARVSKFSQGTRRKRPNRRVRIIHRLAQHR